MSKDKNLKVVKFYQKSVQLFGMPVDKYLPRETK